MSHDTLFHHLSFYTSITSGRNPHPGTTALFYMGNVCFGYGNFYLDLTDRHQFYNRNARQNILACFRTFFSHHSTKRSCQPAVTQIFPCHFLHRLRLLQFTLHFYPFDLRQTLLFIEHFQSLISIPCLVKSSLCCIITALQQCRIDGSNQLSFADGLPGVHINVLHRAWYGKTQCGSVFFLNGTGETPVCGR